MESHYTVSEINRIVSQMFSAESRFQDIWIEGEISGFRTFSSGHSYFTLKDSGSELRCTLFKFAALRVTFKPRDGDKVLAHGKLTVYEVKGEYQLNVDQIMPAGVGDLYAQFEMLKAKLAAEGLFDPERKRPLPILPRVIGVVTSPGAAAFQDVLNVLRRRYPLARVVLSPTLVQGAEAPPQIVRALDRLNARDDVDVILVCRGGGSLEDLWAFNDERVARAIAASRLPVIAGVGHETDTTLTDFVADVRAPTPSAAAELLTPYSVLDLRAGLEALQRDLVTLLSGFFRDRRAEVEAHERTLRRLSPRVQIGSYRQRVDDFSARLWSAQRSRLALLREQVRGRADALIAASPQAILERGYALVTRLDGTRIRSAAEVEPGARLDVQMRDGRFRARAEPPER
jgi:exodeoxyribonuclease VII large subunit